MDSLTQITLGAAVGEVVLGRKAGNRAMLWGAIGGTIPDLDVFANMATDEISALAFHRAITHSFAFAALAPIALGWLIHRLYAGEGFGKAAGWAALSLLSLIGLGSLTMPVPPGEVGKVALAITAAILAFPLLSFVYRRLRKREPLAGNPSWQSWAWLFFWSIFTHPLLDACTTYGTQLLRPFSDYRVAFNNISVADPAYTLPFLFCLLGAWVAGRRRQQLRNALNRAGLVLSSIYLLFTFYNKYRVDQVFEASLQRQGIAYERYMTSPTILNNLLWQGVAEGDSAYYHGMYSIFDARPEVAHFTAIPKNHHLMDRLPPSRDVEVLQWFSDGYYSVLPKGDTALQYNDLRFGSLNNSFERPEDFVFHFILTEENGTVRAQQSRERPKGAGDALGRLWERMMGVE